VSPARHRFAGVAAVAGLWCALGAASLVSGFPLFGVRPLSWLAADRASSGLFSTGLIVGGLLMAAFHGHVRARFPVGAGFSVAMLGGLAAQLVAAVVPIDGDPTAHRVHTAAALVLGTSLPVLMWRFAAAQRPGRWRLVSYQLFCLEVVACAAGVVLSRRSVAPMAEILPAACFHLWVAVLTFARTGVEIERTERVGRPVSTEAGEMPAMDVLVRYARP
jgi:hypothetical protein